MSETTPKSLPPIRDLFSESWNIFTKNIYHFFVLSVISLAAYIAIGVVLFVVVFATGVGGAIMSRGAQNVMQIGGVMGILGIAIFLGILAVLVVSFALTTGYILIAADEKKDMSYWDLFKKGIGFTPAFLWVGFLTFIIVWGGLFVFILPAIFFGVLFSFVSYEVVLSNNRGTKALQQSATIVSQHFFPIFGRWLFLVGVSIFVSIFTSSLQNLTKGSSLIFLVVIASMLCNILLSWFSVVYYVVLYKQAKGATDPHKTSSLVWMWLVSGIGWIIGIALLSIIGVAGLALMKSGAAQDVFKRAQNVNTLQQNYSGSMKSGSQYAEALQTDVFILVNNARTKAGLPLIQQDNQLCAYAQRRLEQLTTYGKWDDAKGFYEDTANPQIVRAYFTGFANINEEGWDAVNASTTSEEIAASWANRKKGTGIVPNPEYIQGCVRGSGQFLIFIAGTSK